MFKVETLNVSPPGVHVSTVINNRIISATTPTEPEQNLSLFIYLIFTGDVSQSADRVYKELI